VGCVLQERQLLEVKADGLFWRERMESLTRDMDKYKERANYHKGIGGAAHYYNNEVSGC